MSENATALAVVARNKNGEVLKVWAKRHEWCSLMQVEVAAVYWAIQLAQKEKWQHIIIEGDAKSCFDPLTTSALQPDWSIATIISNILDTCKFFLNCNFCWVRRCCNTAVHVAAKYTIKFCRICYFNMYSLPVVIVDACKADTHCFVC